MTMTELERLNALTQELRTVKQQNRCLLVLLQQALEKNPVQRGLPSPYAVMGVPR